MTIASAALMLRICHLDHLCVCARKVYCDKMAHWIRMPFGVMSGVGLGMGILDGVVIVEGEEAVWVNLGRPIVTNGTFAMRSCQITLRTCCHVVFRICQQTYKPLP